LSSIPLLELSKTHFGGTPTPALASNFRCTHHVQHGGGQGWDLSSLPPFAAHVSRTYATCCALLSLVAALIVPACERRVHLYARKNAIR
jgi:hypothetical protein